MTVVDIPTQSPFGNPYRNRPGQHVTVPIPSPSTPNGITLKGPAQGDLHGFNSTPGAGGTADQDDAYARITDTLSLYGLGSLAQWAWNEILSGRSMDGVLLDMQQTPEFKQRFPAIEQRQKAGLPPISPADYINYENQAYQLMRAAGLPAGFYDQHEDFTNFIAKDVSISELNDRINQGYELVVQADPNVRKAFGDFFGPSGDAAMAAVFLDPDAALPVLEQEAQAALFAGTGTNFGFAIGKDLAMRVAANNLPSYQVRAGFDTLAGEKNLFENTVGEQNAGSNLTEDQGITATFGVGDDVAAAKAAMLRRHQQRLAEFAGGGGAVVTGHGVRGLGSSEGNV